MENIKIMDRLIRWIGREKGITGENRECAQKRPPPSREEKGKAKRPFPMFPPQVSNVNNIITHNSFPKGLHHLQGHVIFVI